MKPGYLYVLVHPSEPDLYKVGVTILEPVKRLAQHNSQHDKYAGRIVKATGQKWEIKTHIVVAGPYCAERAFWAATPLADIPFRGGVEVARMEWRWVEQGLEAAKKASTRPIAKPVHDWVYAYTAWMHKRLAGRGIFLVGHVRSKFGRSDFRCSAGHEWRTMPKLVAEGEGCPQCGIGERTLDEILQAARPAYLCLLTHPDKPGAIRIELLYVTSEETRPVDRHGWEVHRSRYTDEPDLAEKLIWELLGCPMPESRELVGIELSKAEQAIRELIPRIYQEIASADRLIG